MIHPVWVLLDSSRRVCHGAPATKQRNLHEQTLRDGPGTREQGAVANGATVSMTEAARERERETERHTHTHTHTHTNTHKGVRGVKQMHSADMHAVRATRGADTIKAASADGQSGEQKPAGCSTTHTPIATNCVPPSPPPPHPTNQPVKMCEQRAVVAMQVTGWLWPCSVFVHAPVSMSNTRTLPVCIASKELG